MAKRNKLLKDSGEFPRNLSKGSLNCFVLALIKMVDQLLDGRLCVIEFLSPVQELLLLGSKAGVLIESFLIDVLVLLESFIDLLDT
jgi:hypothetical protein